VIDRSFGGTASLRRSLAAAGATSFVRQAPPSLPGSTWSYGGQAQPDPYTRRASKNC
jgi:hypothetical protein